MVIHGKSVWFLWIVLFHSTFFLGYQTQQLKAREQQQQQQQQQQQLQLLRQQQQPPRRDGSHITMNGVANGVGADNMLRQQTTANALATKIYEECLKHPQKRDGQEDATMKVGRKFREHNAYAKQNTNNTHIHCVCMCAVVIILFVDNPNINCSYYQEINNLVIWE